MTTPILALHDVAVSHGPAPVLAGVTLAVAPGEALALLGRNGAGKTTLIHALFNLGPRRTGSIRLCGTETAGWPTHRIARHGAALVAQARGTFATLTVHDNLAVAALRAPPGPWTPARVLDRFPVLAARRTALAGALSGGERQMLAIGRALLTQPRLLVLDEPSEGLAPLAAEALVTDLVRELTATGLAILLAEQNLPLVFPCCARVAVLNQGTLAFTGPAATLEHDPALVRHLMGV